MAIHTAALRWKSFAELSTQVSNPTGKIMTAKYIVSSRRFRSINRVHTKEFESDSSKDADQTNNMIRFSTLASGPSFQNTDSWEHMSQKCK